jgi:uncharacterized protein
MSGEEECCSRGRGVRRALGGGRSSPPPMALHEDAAERAQLVYFVVAHNAVTDNYALPLCSYLPRPLPLRTPRRRRISRRRVRRPTWSPRRDSVLHPESQMASAILSRAPSALDAVSRSLVRTSVGHALLRASPVLQTRLASAVSVRGSPSTRPSTPSSASPRRALSIMASLAHQDDAPTRIMGHDKYGFTVNDIRMRGSILAFANFTLLWDVQHAVEISPRNLAAVSVIRPKPEILLIGTGEKMVNVNPALFAYFSRRGIAVDAMTTVRHDEPGKGGREMGGEEEAPTATYTAPAHEALVAFLVTCCICPPPPPSPPLPPRLRSLPPFRPSTRSSQSGATCARRSSRASQSRATRRACTRRTRTSS